MTNEKRTVEIIMNGEQPGATIRQLTQDAKILAASLRDLAPGTEAFIKQSDKLKEVSASLASTKEQAGFTRSALKDLHDEADHGTGVFKKFGEIMTAVFTGQVLANAVEFLGEKIHDLFSEVFSGSIEAATRLDQANIKQSAVLIGMGNAAALNKKELAALTEEIEKNTNFRKVETEEAENLLLTYDKINKDIFPRALKDAADMASLFDGDLKRSTEALARALEDPAKGVDKLRRAHITLSPEVAKFIKDTANSGDVLGAQKLLLDEVEKRFGGVAKAAHDADSSIKIQFNKTLEDLEEKFGMVLIKGIYPFIQGVGKMISAVSEFLFPAKQQNEILEEQRIGLNALVSQIMATNTADDTRRQLMNDLNKQYPDFLGNLDHEKASNSELAARLKEVNEQMLNKIIIQKVQDELEEKLKKAGDARLTAIREETRLRGELQKKSEEKHGSGTVEELYGKTIQDLLKSGKDLQTVEKELDAFENKYGMAWSQRKTAIFDKFNQAMGDFKKNNNVASDLAAEKNKLEQELGIKLGDSEKPASNPNFTPLDPDAAKKAEQRKKDNQVLLDQIYDQTTAEMQKEEDRELRNEKKRHDGVLREIADSKADQQIKDNAKIAEETYFQKNLSNITDKFTKERLDSEYETNLTNIEKWHTQEILSTTNQFNQGLLTRKQFEAKLKDIQDQALEFRIETKKEFGKAADDDELTQATAQAEKLKKIQEETTAKLEEVWRNRAADTEKGTKEHYDAEVMLLYLKYQKELDLTTLGEKEKAAIKAKYASAFQKLDDQYAKDKTKHIKDESKEYIDDAEKVADSLNTIAKQNSDAALAKEKSDSDAKIATLDDELKHKQISQANYDTQVKAINDQYTKDERKAKHDQALNDQALSLFKAGIAIALGEVEAISTGDYIKAAALAVVGAANIAVIANEPIPALAEGGLIPVRAGNTTYNAKAPSKLAGYVSHPSLALVGESPEYVISSEMMKTPAGINLARIAETLRINKTYDAGGYMSTGTYPPLAGAGGGSRSTWSAPSHTSTDPQLLALLKEHGNLIKAVHATLKAGIPARLDVTSAARDARRLGQNPFNSNNPLTQ